MSTHFHLQRVLRRLENLSLEDRDKGAKLKRFEEDAIKILTLAPHYQLSFREFTQMYERQFQGPISLDISAYGFGSLSELFRSMRDILEVSHKYTYSDGTLYGGQVQLKEAVRRRVEEEEELTCIVCMDFKREVVLVPCTHNNLCRPCAVKIFQEDGRCPIDRILITDIVPLSVAKQAISNQDAPIKY